MVLTSVIYIAFLIGLLILYYIVPGKIQWLLLLIASIIFIGFSINNPLVILLISLGLGRSHGLGNGNPLQHSCLGNPIDRGAGWAIVPWGHKRVGHDLATKQQWQKIHLPKQEAYIQSLDQKDPLEKEMATCSSILA